MADDVHVQEAQHIVDDASALYQVGNVTPWVPLLRLGVIAIDVLTLILAELRTANKRKRSPE